MSVYVIAFESTHAAMAASKALSDAGVRFETIPVPTAISAGCGIALRFEDNGPEKVLSCLFDEPFCSDTAALYRQIERGRFERDGALGGIER